MKNINKFYKRSIKKLQHLEKAILSFKYVIIGSYHRKSYNIKIFAFALKERFRIFFSNNICFNLEQYENKASVVSITCKQLI